MISPARGILHDNTQHSQRTNIHRNPLYKRSTRRTDLYLKTHNNQSGQTSIGLLCKCDQAVAQTSNIKPTTLTTYRYPFDSSVQGISPSHTPLSVNTQHSEQRDIHTIPLYKGSALRTGHYLTTHNTHNGRTTKGLLCKSDHPTQRSLPKNKQHSQQTDIYRTSLYK